MTKFPTDCDPEFFASSLEEPFSNTWVHRIALMIPILIGVLGVALRWNMWFIVAIYFAAYFSIPLIFKLCNRKQKSREKLGEFSSFYERRSSSLAATWKQILEGNPPKPWVVFRHGTCVILNEPVTDPVAEAKQLLKKWGPYVAGTSSGDMLIYTLRNDLGFVVGGGHPNIFSFVDSEICLGGQTSSCLPGLVGRYIRDLDAKELIIVQEYELMIQSALLQFNKHDWHKISEIIDELLNQGIYYEGFENFVGINDAHINREKDLFPAFLSLLKKLRLRIPLNQEEAVWIILKKNIQEMLGTSIDPITALQQFMRHDCHLYDFYSRTKQCVGDSHGIHNLIGIYWSYVDMRENEDINEDTLRQIENEIIISAKEWFSLYGKYDPFHILV